MIKIAYGLLHRGLILFRPPGLLPLSEPSRALWALPKNGFECLCNLQHLRTSCSDTFFHVGTKVGGELAHLVRFLVRDGARDIAAAKVTLLAKAVESVNDFFVWGGSEFQRLDNAIVMVVPRGPITRSSQGSGGWLESRVVGNREAPVGR